MSFLDSLENNLKALESQEDRQANQEDQRKQRDAERANALATAPWAEKLKSSTYTQDLMVKATEAGHKIRAKVYLTWLGTTLRLQVRDRKLDLRPTHDGILAVFTDGGAEEQTRPVDLTSDPKELLQQWLGPENPPK